MPDATPLTAFHQWMLAELPRALPSFLPGQRWYGGKGRGIQRIELSDTAPLPDDGQALALALVAVHYDDGATERYGLVLAARERAEGQPVVGTWDGVPVRTVVEAAQDPDTVLALLRLAASGHPVATAAGGRIGGTDVSAAARQSLAGASREAVSRLGAEQSNTSVRVGNTLTLKMFRRVPDGENPEVEIGRALAATSFPHMAALAGALSYDRPARPRSTLAVIQRWVDNAGDGWAHVVSALSGARGSGLPGSVGADLETLGAVTAGFHHALSQDSDDPALSPEPVAPQDAARWRADVEARGQRTLALVEAQRGGWSDPVAQLAADLLARRRDLPTALPLFEAQHCAGLQAIRIHGDYHLGQTLKTASGFVIIDFEGEPTRPLAERCEKQCALKDVAGMLRSFDYAVETASRSDGAPDGRWQRDALAAMRDHFLRGYLDAAGSAARFLPPAAHMDRWLRLFELEKALYELEYEARNRPGWLAIPLRGLLRTLG